MAATDLVPCFYAGQNYHVDLPAEHRLRSEVRECKRQKLGEFRENGKIFLFFKMLAQKAKQLWDGPLGIGNALPFFKVQNPLLQPTKLHYSTPMANDNGIRRWGLRSHRMPSAFATEVLTTRTLRVSARSRHSQQFIAEAIRPLVPAHLAGSI
jgi:hypothetical protein